MFNLTHTIEVPFLRQISLTPLIFSVALLR